MVCVCIDVCETGIFLFSSLCFYFIVWYLEFAVGVISNQIAFSLGTMDRLAAWTIGHSSPGLNGRYKTNVCKANISSSSPRKISDGNFENRVLKEAANSTWNKSSEKNENFWMQKASSRAQFPYEIPQHQWQGARSNNALLPPLLFAPIK